MNLNSTNTALIHCSYTEIPVHHKRIGLISLYTRKEVVNHELQVMYVPKDRMLADAFTKPVQHMWNIFCADGFGLYPMG